MNNINCVLEAAGELDDTILESVFKPRRRKRAVLIAIAAAAALALLAGFTVAYRNSAVIDGKPMFEYNIEIRRGVTPLSEEELAKMGALNIRKQPDGILEYEMQDIDPRELITRYNITPLAGDIFLRADLGDYSTADRDAEEYRRLFLSRTRVTVVSDHHSDGMYGSYVGFNYWLVDNSLDIPVNFRSYCITDDYNAALVQSITSARADGSDVKIVELNSGEKAVINQTDYTDGENSSLASFTYEGILYYLHADTDINGMERILSDLGIADEYP